jgi:hypothetical protein
MSINDKDFSSLTVEQYGWNLGFLIIQPHLHHTLFMSTIVINSMLD